MWVTTKILKNTEVKVVVATNNTIRHLLQTTGMCIPTSLYHRKAWVEQSGSSFYLHIKNIYIPLKTTKKTPYMQHIS
jgi:hypothetical protein